MYHLFQHLCLPLQEFLQYCLVKSFQSKQSEGVPQLNHFVSPYPLLEEVLLNGWVSLVSDSLHIISECYPQRGFDLLCCSSCIRALIRHCNSQGATRQWLCLLGEPYFCYTFSLWLLCLFSQEMRVMQAIKKKNTNPAAPKPPAIMSTRFRWWSSIVVILHICCSN